MLEATGTTIRVVASKPNTTISPNLCIATRTPGNLRSPERDTQCGGFCVGEDRGRTRLGSFFGIMKREGHRSTAVALLLPADSAVARDRERLSACLAPALARRRGESAIPRAPQQ